MTGVPHKRYGMQNEMRARSSFPSRIRIGEVLSYVAQGQSAQKGINQGMKHNVSVAMRYGAMRRWYLHATKDQRLTFCQAMNIVTKPNHDVQIIWWKTLCEPTTRARIHDRLTFPYVSVMNQDAETVANLTGRIQGLLQHGIGDVVVLGELSNYKHHTSGHRYFTLKDESAAIACVMWRTRPLAIRPEDGMLVVLHGRLTVYPPRGNYQIDVVSMVPAGQGSLQQQLEERKKSLAAQGYFAWERKRPLPAMPMRIGVITSPTGAALQDILSTIASRFPSATVFFRPALVQGPGAAEDIAAAVQEFSPDVVDLLIVGRGGGSIEDLWAFNEIIVANALFASSVPIISAVGHETDDTIADLVADVRAATPTHAAVLATPFTRADVMALVAESRDRLMAAMASNVSDARDMVHMFTEGASARRLLERIAVRQQWIDDRLERSSLTLIERLRARRERLATMAPRAAAAVAERLRGRSARLVEFGPRYAVSLSQRLRLRGAMLTENRTRAQAAILRHISRTIAVVDRHHAVCRALHPLAPLRRGFAVLERNKEVVKPTDLLLPGEVVTVRRFSQTTTVVVQSSESPHGPAET